jgi:DNA-binding transcriptional regulator YiaG
MVRQFSCIFQPHHKVKLAVTANYAEPNTPVSHQMKITGRHVAAARELLQITQEHLARAANINVHTLSSFELGVRSPRSASLEAIHTALEQRGIEFTNGDSPGVRFNPAKAIIPRGS